MKLFGLGDVTGIYDYVLKKIKGVKSAKEEEKLCLEEEMEFAVETEPELVPFKLPEQTESGSDGVVLYIRWPMKSDMFVDVRSPSAKSKGVELQSSHGRWGESEPSGHEAENARPLDEADVLSIPDIVNIPVLRPVGQEERLTNIDILNTRGIFIGLSQINPEYYLDIAEKNPEFTLSPGFAEEEAPEKNEAALGSLYEPEVYNRLLDAPLKNPADSGLTGDIAEIFATGPSRDFFDVIREELPVTDTAQLPIFETLGQPVDTAAGHPAAPDRPAGAGIPQGKGKK